MHPLTSPTIFGGGPESRFDNQSGRSDVDLLVVWEVENSGYGHRAARSRAVSQLLIILATSWLSSAGNFVRNSSFKRFSIPGAASAILAFFISTGSVSSGVPSW